MFGKKTLQWLFSLSCAYTQLTMCRPTYGLFLFSKAFIPLPLLSLSTPVCQASLLLSLWPIIPMGLACTLRMLPIASNSSCIPCFVSCCYLASYHCYKTQWSRCACTHVYIHTHIYIACVTMTRLIYP